MDEALVSVYAWSANTVRLSLCGQMVKSGDKILMEKEIKYMIYLFLLQKTRGFFALPVPSSVRI